MADQYLGTVVWLGTWDSNLSYSYIPNALSMQVIYQGNTYITIGVPEDGVPPPIDTNAWVQTGTLNSGGGGLPSMTGKAGQLLTNNGTVASWTNYVGDNHVLNPITITETAINQALEDLASNDQPLHKSIAQWIYATPVSTFQIEIPARTQRITLNFKNLSYQANDPSPAIQLQNADGGIIGTGYIGCNTTNTTTGNVTNRDISTLINIKTTGANGAINGTYELNSFNNNEWACQGGHASSDNQITTSQWRDITLSQTPKYLYFTANATTFNSGVVTAWFL